MAFLKYPMMMSSLDIIIGYFKRVKNLMALPDTGNAASRSSNSDLRWNQWGWRQLFFWQLEMTDMKFDTLSLLYQRIYIRPRIKKKSICFFQEASNV